jgi:hypothetical protein
MGLAEPLATSQLGNALRNQGFGGLRWQPVRAMTGRSRFHEIAVAQVFSWLVYWCRAVGSGQQKSRFGGPALRQLDCKYRFSINGLSQLAWVMPEPYHGVTHNSLGCDAELPARSRSFCPAHCVCEATPGGHDGGHRLPGMGGAPSPESQCVQAAL